MNRTLSLRTVSTKQQRIAELAREDPDRVITSLSHHIDLAWLRRAYQLIRKDGAVGVDGLVAQEYEEELESNLLDLLDRFKSGTYRAQPVRRVEIPKAGGKTRPIGILTLEDKILQRAVLMALEPLYEQDFYNFSHGFRPGRSAHKAIEQMRDDLWRRGGVVIELDIQSFFDTIGHQYLRDFLDKRMRDGVLRRTIDKWLRAGVSDGGVVRRLKVGTPQGGVISPLLANIFLHEVLDTWFVRDVAPNMRGPCSMVRYADDGVLMFSNMEDAERVMTVLPKRFVKFGLTLHPEKTRIIDFRRPNRDDRKGPGSFDFLGFTLHWGRSRKGNWVVKHKTSKKSFRRARRAIWEWVRDHRHMPARYQHQQLTLKLRGHYLYFGIAGNSRMLNSFRYFAGAAWRYWLARRGDRKGVPWERFKRLLQFYPLPPARLVQRYPQRT